MIMVLVGASVLQFFGENTQWAAFYERHVAIYPASPNLPNEVHGDCLWDDRYTLPFVRWPLYTDI